MKIVLSSQVAHLTYALNAPVTEIKARTTSEGGTKAHAIYADNRFDLGNWVITPGLRFESIETHNNFTAYNQGVAVKYRFTRKLIQMSFYQAYRLCIKRQTIGTFCQCGRLIRPTAIQPIGTFTKVVLHKAQLMACILKSPITMKLGRSILGNGLNAELTAFYLDFKKELILERDAQNNGIWTDLGATSHKGVELGLGL